MTSRIFGFALLVSAAILAQQRYTGAPPAKKDLPYLVQSGNLVETELGMAQPRDDGDRVTYVIPGANSPVKTQTASPSFVFYPAQLDSTLLQLYRVESKGGHREISIPKQGRGPRPVPMITTKLGDRLVQLDPVDALAKGEYSLTPQGSNAVFCFGVN